MKTNIKVNLVISGENKKQIERCVHKHERVYMESVL